jgi:Fe-S-cluster containining protein
MGKECLKFVSISEALGELKNTLMMQSEEQNQKEIGPIIAGFEEFEVQKDVLKAYPFGLIERHGLWIESEDNKEFYYGIDLVEFFLGLLNSKPSDVIAKVYSKIELVSATVAKHQKTGANGLLIKTEMEKFKCVQCGHCCLDLSDAYQTSVPDSDIIRWELENRYDILEWVDSFAGLNDIWVNPKTGESVSRCPWLRKLPKKDKYICKIHETKPKHCHKFPKSKRHAIDNGCKGFHTKSAFDNTGLPES